MKYRLTIRCGENIHGYYPLSPLDEVQEVINTVLSWGRGSGGKFTIEIEEMEERK